LTIASRPSEERDNEDIGLIWGSAEAEYFCDWGWTGILLICPTDRFFEQKLRRDKAFPDLPNLAKQADASHVYPNWIYPKATP
jgi:hypothetical protein